MTSDNLADEPEIELTNPSERLSEHCSNAVINGMEFSVPCTYEELSEHLVLKPDGAVFFRMGSIEAGRTTGSETEARPGEGCDPPADRDIRDIGYTYTEYTFEEVYSEDTVFNCRVWFNPLKTLS